MTKTYRDIRVCDADDVDLYGKIDSKKTELSEIPPPLIHTHVFYKHISDVFQVHIALDLTSKVSKGIAFIKFSDPSCAVKAFEELDKTSFQGRLLHILPAIDRDDSGVQRIEEGGGRTTLRNEKEKQRKETSSKEFNWSMLYMNVRIIR
jgi:RNA recognition motif-containing protein